MSFMRNLGLFFIIVLLLSGCTTVKDKSPNETGVLLDMQPNIKYLAEGDSGFLMAKELAQKNIDYFIKALASYNKSLTYSLKAGFIDGDMEEHMWVDTLYYDSDYFYGHLANYPAEVKTYGYWDEVNISMVDVEDWMIWNTENDEYQGYFSKNVLT